MIVSICKEEVDSLNKKYTIHNFISNGDVKLDNAFLLLHNFLITITFLVLCTFDYIV